MRIWIGFIEREGEFGLEDEMDGRREGEKRENGRADPVFRAKWFVLQLE